MPLLVTGGLGLQELSTSGPTLIDASSSGYIVELPFNEEIILAGDAADPAKWSISPVTVGAAPVHISGVSVMDASIFLAVSEQTQGATYSISIPYSGITNVAYSPFTGPFAINFSGIGAGPIIVQAYQTEARLLSIIFNEPVNVVDATDPSKYSVTPSIVVKSVAQVTPYQFVLKTSKQDPDATYTVTAVGVRDESGNT